MHTKLVQGLTWNWYFFARCIQNLWPQIKDRDEKKIFKQSELELWRLSCRDYSWQRLIAFYLLRKTQDLGLVQESSWGKRSAIILLNGETITRCGLSCCSIYFWWSILGCQQQNNALLTRSMLFEPYPQIMVVSGKGRQYQISSV